MKISYNWLKNYLHNRLPAPKKVAQLLTQTGLEVTAIDTFEPVAPQLCIGEVKSCIKHPAADKLQLAEINLGTKKKKLKIVCGASNLQVGQQVIVAPEGTELTPSAGKDLSYQIKKRTIRGEESQGMICSLEEIGFLDSHKEGIHVLEKKYTNGTPLYEAWDLQKDFVFEIELTPNRGDAISHLGVARDLAALLDREIETPILSPLLLGDNSVELNLQVKTATCPRYAGLLLKAVKVKPSPILLQTRLKAIGVKPVNNIVDITNYVMHDMGQPLHAFDFEKMKGKKIGVKKLTAKNRITLLDGKTYQLNQGDTVVEDASGPIALAGIMGGKSTAITNETRMVFLESAYFLPEPIVKTARCHQLSTDAAYRFSRGTDPSIVYPALQRAANLLQKNSQAVVGSQVVEYYPKPIKGKTIATCYTYFHQVIGIEISPKQIEKILKLLDINIIPDKNRIGHFFAEVPPYRVDVTRPIDLVEEFLRIYGYNESSLETKTDKLSQVPPSFSSTPLSVQLEKEDTIKEFLIAKGLQEIITNPLTKSTYTTWHKKLNLRSIPKIKAPLSEELDALRQTLLFSGLEVLRHNLNRNSTVLKFFEMGKSYSYYQGEYKERSRLAIWLAGENHSTHWEKKARKVRFTDLSSILYNLFYRLGISLESFSIEQRPYPGYENAVLWMKNGKKIVEMGWVDPIILSNMKIKLPVLYASIKTDRLAIKPTKNKSYAPITPFPAVIRDISLQIEAKFTYLSLEKKLLTSQIPYLDQVKLIDTYKDPKQEKIKNYTLRLRLQGDKKTLSQKEIQKSLQKAILLLKEHYNASIR